MITSKQHQDKPLFSITDGKKLGDLKDLYLDASLHKVVAVFLGSEGLINRKLWVIERASIIVFGVDTWLVAGSDKVRELGSLSGSDSFVLASAVRGRDIYSEGQTKLASIDDIVLNAEAEVLGFTLDKVYVRGPVAERKTIARSAISSFGSHDSPMLTTLAEAEAAGVAEA